MTVSFTSFLACEGLELVASSPLLRTTVLLQCGQNYVFLSVRHPIASLNPGKVLITEHFYRSSPMKSVETLGRE